MGQEPPNWSLEVEAQVPIPRAALNTPGPGVGAGVASSTSPLLGITVLDHLKVTSSSANPARALCLDGQALWVGLPEAGRVGRGARLGEVPL